MDCAVNDALRLVLVSFWRYAVSSNEKIRRGIER